MATSNYDPVSWTSGPITTDALQQMANNEQWLFENMPRMSYKSTTVNRSSGVKIASGRALFGDSGRDYAEVPVYFGNFFTLGCAPVVVATVHSHGGLRTFCSVRGIGGAGTIDGRGFSAHVTAHENYPHGVNRIKGGILNWVAVGY